MKIDIAENKQNENEFIVGYSCSYIHMPTIFFNFSFNYF